MEPATGRGRRHGTSSSEPFDRWFRYPAGFASDYVSVLLGHLALKPGSLVVDPFSGSAVTGTAARSAGLSFYGVEAHPLICELGQLKLQTPPGPPEDLRATAKRIAKTAEHEIMPTSSDVNGESELVRRCFSESVLIRLVSLRNAIKRGDAADWELYLKWALLATLRDVAAVRVGWPYQRPANARRPTYSDVVARFQQRASWIADDIGTIYNLQTPVTNVRMQQGDSRARGSWSPIIPAYAQGCVSSPPYLNNFDYADATRLELYFWGDVSSWSQMVSSVRSDMLVATTQQSSVPCAANATEALQGYGPAADLINELTGALRSERTNRSRGKEYDRVLPAYFHAIAQVLDNLADVLIPGAQVVWLVGDSAPYGVYIDTPALICQIAGQVGFDTEKDVVLRRRGQRWSGNSVRHAVDLSERLVLLRRQ